LALDTPTVQNMQAFGIDADGDLAPPPGIAAFAREVAAAAAPAQPDQQAPSVQDWRGERA
jgi:hypothetical protein